MSDQPVTLIVFAQFYRQVILPDIERVVLNAVERLETEIRADLRRLEQRPDR